ncbi:MAG TPA: PQQ-binding-like beta-propeller repeat protein [Bryobacteraceae bacterium]|nr:PQQ-binding-like beta-propeller repeat protein [Bryobacteraceae bacterium]
MFVRTLAGFAAVAAIAMADDWPMFRGHNASGVSPAKNLPVEFGPQKNVVWKTILPPGHSSPVLSANRIFLTAVDGEKLLVFCLERETGKILWRREAPRPRKQELHKSNSAASPSIATDGRNVFAFFTDFGLISYGPDGEERWRAPLGPFNNPFGMGASPVLVNGKVIQACDAETGSFLIAVDQRTGKTIWRKERPDATRGFSTPVLHRSEGRMQAILAGTNKLTAYDVDTGDEVWWVRGLTWQVKPTPVIEGDIVYVLGWAGGSDQGNQENLPPFPEVLGSFDANKDGKLAKEELPNPNWQRDFAEADLERDGALGARDWQKYREKRASVNSVMAVRLGGKGDMTEKGIVWQHFKSLPNATSPLQYQGVIYLMKEGGILTALDAKTGAMLKQGRLPGALDYYYSSPVGADGKVYAASENCHVSVVKAGGDWEPLARNDFEDLCYATPAPVDDKLYLRTSSALYCFGLGQ